MLSYRSMFLFLDVVIAMPWMGPMVTPVGLWPANGISPRPTSAPGLDGIPRELLKRERLTGTSLPPNYCGFINSDTDLIFSCDAVSTCASDSYAFGCCADLDTHCTNLYTSCVGWFDYPSSCDLSCQADTSIAKCLDSYVPFCAGYSFKGGKYFWGCLSTLQALATVEPIPDWIATFSNTYTTETTARTTPRTTPRTTTSSTSSPTPTPAPTSHGGIAAGAIGGIVAGVGVLAICCAILVFVCIRRRNSRRAAQQSMPQAMPNQGSQPQYPPPMQQQQPLGLPGHQSIPPQYQPQTGYLKQPNQGSTYASAGSHGQPSPIQSNFPNYDLNHRTSTVTSNPFSPVPSTMSGNGTHTLTKSEFGDPQSPYSTPSPPPMMAEADSKISTLNMQSMEINHDAHQQQSTPPAFSEIHGSPMMSNLQPIQTNQDIHQHQSPPSEVHGSPVMSTTQFQQDGTSYRTQSYTTPSHQESHAPGPWEMGGGR